jgi:glucuronate isomerase
MSTFQGKDFLLTNSVAKDLYHNHASEMPIFDFHCHLPPKEIYEDHKFSSLTECWIGANGYGDHYKWRLMREYGIDESFITGKAPDKEKFLKYAEVMPYLVGNPIYEWTHLELKHFFGIEETLSPKTAEMIYAKANEKLQTLTARKMMEISNVDTVFTTDDPVDDLHYHELIQKDNSFKIHVFPCLRPDKAINVERSTFIPWVQALEKVSGHGIDNLQTMLDDLDKRIAYFVEHGCVATDHALDIVHYKKASYEEANLIFQKGIKGEAISYEEEDIYKGYVLAHLGRIYHRYNLVQQYHIGAFRNVSDRTFKLLGPDTGYDAVEDAPIAENLRALLNDLDARNELPKTVFYTLNPKDYVVLVTLMNGFQGGMKGKIQLGTSWWFNDHYDGMRQQLQVLAEDGLLSCFIGMLTDSRSFLSYPRHDYFRREFCAYLGELVEMGRYPDDREILGKIVEDVSFNNAKNYFKR